MALLDANMAEKNNKRANKMALSEAPYHPLARKMVAALAAKEPKGRPNGAKMRFKIASAANVEYQSIFDANIVRKLIKNQAQNR